MNELCVCVLAHNEEKHIADTIRAIVASCGSVSADIKVYANGCSDRTVEIVHSLSEKIPNLSLRQLDVASKPNAWNTAFYENNHKILVFSDGDVLPEPNAVQALYQLLNSETSNVALAGCSVCPRKSDLNIGQRIIGFLQMPLHEDFLSGALYALQKNEFEAIFNTLNLNGIPLGIVAEDAFVQEIVPAEQFTIINKKVYYEPPALKDYCKYLARIRWQEEQLVQEYNGLVSKHADNHKSFFSRLKSKIINSSSTFRFLTGLLACILRMIIKFIFRSTINNYYVALGPVSKDGKGILSQATRSQSAK
ncbi:MAG: glycosyltransferase family 2 protein [Desulfuromonadaceae bacterium]|nr:glycosyltransferase family 2 protein [Desulfuromonadaceae bacterium]